jgi:hypothetical protein
MATTTIQDRIQRRYAITMEYLNNQTPEKWALMARDVLGELRHMLRNNDPELEPLDLHTELIGVLQVEYQADVNSLAEDLIESWADEDKGDDGQPDRDEAHATAVAEAVDASQWVIYTHRAMLVPLLGNHADALFGGAGLWIGVDHSQRNMDGNVQGSIDEAQMSNVYSQIALCAMEADVLAIIAAREEEGA